MMSWKALASFAMLDGSNSRSHRTISPTVARTATQGVPHRLMRRSAAGRMWSRLMASG